MSLINSFTSFFNLFPPPSFYPTIQSGGSVKDRVGLRMLREAEKDGRIKPGDTLIEPTSGNTGIGLCLAGALAGYKVLITMPLKMSGEKLNTMKALGAEILRTPTEAGWDDELSHISLAAELAETSPNAHVLDQYLNAGNPLSHYDGTGTEILQQTEGKVDVVVVGAGTGGTVTGIAKKIKEGAPHCKIVAVDPVGSILAIPDSLNDYKRLEGYQVEGIGYDFIPTVLDRQIVDEWVKIDDPEAFEMARKMIQIEGMMVGGSSGTAMAGAHAYIKAHEKELKGKRVVIVCPDSIRNYMSKFLDDAWMKQHGFKQSLSADQLPSAPLKKVAYAKRMAELEKAKQDKKVSQEEYLTEKASIEKRLGPSK
jgi:cystathionine beta-synthase